jgi:hypothetical protein
VTITRQDIEAKANQLVSAVNQTKDSARDTAVVAGVVVAVLVLLAFIFGRRRGSRNQTLVEVYRVWGPSTREPRVPDTAQRSPAPSVRRRGLAGGFYHLDPRVAAPLVVDDEGGAFGEAPSEYEAATGSCSTHICERGQAKTGVELALVARA